ncbi:MAG: bifunctional adenosylcobinamide kinase/adenosylcobinamide-phosphate guanylyltransferase [Candidatus Rokubacteria bacterium]|nr:bifunctional adenosylcobinamide kinase/adenosylcobinamide-phosphate guanylyltransferase [Candidatus Rokubacteria bacterium]
MTAPPSSLLILGGARSGKSRFAVAEAQARPGRVAVVATAEALDPNMAARIAHHRRERPASWLTVEEPLELVPALRRVVARADTVLVDCLTLWVANQFHRGVTEEAILASGEDLAKFVAERASFLILVSNEVGQGVHPETASGLRFRDLLGAVNQTVAQAVDRVVLMVAGLPLTLKDQRPDERPPEAP